MRYILMLLGILVMAACGEQAEKEGVVISPQMERVRDSVDTYFTKLTELQKFNGVLLVYKNDTLLLKKYLVHRYACSENSTVVFSGVEI